MRYFRIFGVVFLLVGLAFAWDMSVVFIISTSDNYAPYGNTKPWRDSPAGDPCEWLDNGMHFATWMVDVDKDEKSAVMYPGDQAYGHSYWYEPDSNYSFGVYTFCMNNFTTRSRDRNIEIDLGDQLHIRLVYRNPRSGETEFWFLDTTFTEAPLGYSIDIWAQLQPARKWDSSAPKYPCFQTSALDAVPPDFYLIRRDLGASALPEFEFGVPHDSPVLIEIVDIKGDRVHLMVDTEKTAGIYRFVWDGLDSSGKPVKPGFYIAHLSSEDKDLWIRFPVMWLS